MKRILSLICMLVLAISVGSVFAQEHQADEETSFRTVDVGKIDYDDSPINKLGRGMINTATCWAEIPAQAIRVSQEKDPLIGFTLGAAEGVVTALARGATGIFEAVTFPVASYDEPVLEPEYAHQSFDQAFQEYLW